jgi:Glycosyl transferases group 1
MRLIVADLEAYSHFVSREFSYIIRELIEAYGWMHLAPSTLWGPGMREKIARYCGEFPEVILFWGGENFLCEHDREVEKLPASRWFLSDDLHHHNARAPREKAFMLCDTLLATYAYRVAEYFPKVAEARRVIWLPHSASPDFALPFNARATNELLLSGAICNAYPMRQRLNDLMESGFPGIVRQPHPGYHCGYRYGNDCRVGRAFARRIWEHRAAFTDCTRYQYAVAKHFEIPATGTLLVADSAIEGPLKELGFRPGVHYLPVSDDTLEDRVRYVLGEEHHAELDQIRRNGQALVLERHRTSHRAKLVNDLSIS